MVTQGPPASSSPLARTVRQRFVAEVDGVILDLAATAQGRLSALADQPGLVREQQSRRDAMVEFLRLRDTWILGVQKAWQQALTAPALKVLRKEVNRRPNTR